MIIGIDVGGTHADGVLLDRGRVIVKDKVVVDHGNLDESILSLLTTLLPENREELQRIHLSTTLCTNALFNDELDDVGMFIQSGPGLNPDFFQCGENIIYVDGAVDHRGQVIRSPDGRKLSDAIAEMAGKGIQSVGIVTKFSHRNNEHEQLVQERLEGRFPHVSLGHRISGMPNFPRRVYTTWLNSGLMSVFTQFRDAMERSLEELGVTCPVYILKADGGTIPFQKACEMPCQSIHSGPSASVMGGLALEREIGEDAILLDIGGTTTDICIFADGTPLLEPYGATVAGRPTLIRALLTRSVGLGGDSVVRWENGFSIGPEKNGPPMSFGGTVPTPTDAMVVLGLIQDGSSEKAHQAMLLLRPGVESEQTAIDLLREFAQCVYDQVETMIEEVFSRPVYTVTDFLERKKLEPGKLIIIGGPALALREFLDDRFSLPSTIPDDFEVANAIGAARARLTVEASLYADTGLGRLSIPEISFMEKPGRMFTIKEAEAQLEEAVKAMAHEMGETSNLQIDFIEKMEMNSVRGFSTTGKIVTLKAQIRPGLSRLEE